MFDDVDEAYWIWNKLTMEIVEAHAPLKTKTVRGNRVPYMNGELRRAINVKNMLRRKYDRVNTKTNWNKYRYQRNIVTKLRKKSINVYLYNKCNSNVGTGKQFWDAVKPLISHKSYNRNDTIILMKDEEVFTNPTVVASLFNNYFTDIAKNIGNEDTYNHDDNVSSCLMKHYKHDSVINIKSFMKSKTKSEFNFHYVTVDVIWSYLHEMKCNKATGWDLLPSRLLKLGSDVLCLSICNLINMSFKVCSFPNMLKCAEISPVFKKGTTLDIGNYRPVSILPCMSKIFEREMVSQLSIYFEDIFSQFLSGFRKKHSCETVLMRMVENIKKYLDEGKIVYVLLMDLSRAFDCIPFKLLISKLCAYGLSMSACELMFNYYSHRKQRVKLGNNVSDWQHVYKGSA